jgi:hypothetical protein
MTMNKARLPARFLAARGDDRRDENRRRGRAARCAKRDARERYPGTGLKIPKTRKIYFMGGHE